MAGSLINRAKLIIKRGALGLGLIILILAPLGVFFLKQGMYREASEEAGNKDQSGSTMDKPIESGNGEKTGGIAH